MKKALFTFFGILLFHSIICSQQLIHGPEIENPKDKLVTKFIDGDAYFYTYHLKTKDDEDSFSIFEKYDKATAKQIYSNKMDLTNMEEILTVGDKVYVFYHKFFEPEKVMAVYFQEISQDGKMQTDIGEMFSVETEQEKFVDFSIIQTPDKSRFLVKVSYKSAKEDAYQTDFVFFDAKTFKILSVKTVAKKFVEKNTAFQNFTGQFYKDIQSINYFTDNEENIYYAYTYTKREPDIKESWISIMVIPRNEAEPRNIDIPLRMDSTGAASFHTVSTVKFVRNNNNELIAGGFFRTVESRSGPDRVRNGIFSYTINLQKYEVTAKAMQYFDDAMLETLNVNPEKQKDLFYKMDYLFPVGNSIYMVGEQYIMDKVNTPSKNFGIGGPTAGGVSSNVNHKYMDVLVIKYDPAGKFEWIRNTPLLYTKSDAGLYALKMYGAIATDKKIYILNNENPAVTKKYSQGFKSKNMEGYTNAAGTNFVYSSVSLEDGKIEHSLIFANKPYCFVAAVNVKKPRLYQYSFFTDYTYITDSEEMFLKSKNDVFIYTHHNGKDRFSKITFE